MPGTPAPNPAILTGNDAYLKIQGITAGFCKSLEVNINNHVEPIKAIGYRKPRGLKSLDWSGTASFEFHVLTVTQEGVIQMNTNSDAHADDLYTVEVIHKATKKRVGILIGAIQTEGFSVNNNEFTGRRIEMELKDWQPLEGFN